MTSIHAPTVAWQPLQRAFDDKPRTACAYEVGTLVHKLFKAAAPSADSAVLCEASAVAGVSWGSVVAFQHVEPALRSLARRHGVTLAG